MYNYLFNLIVWRRFSSRVIIKQPIRLIHDHDLYFQRLERPPPVPLFLMTFVVNYLPMIDYIAACLFVICGLLLWTVAMRTTFR